MWSFHKSHNPRTKCLTYCRKADLSILQEMHSMAFQSMYKANLSWLLLKHSNLRVLDAHFYSEKRLQIWGLYEIFSFRVMSTKPLSFKLNKPICLSQGSTNLPFIIREFFHINLHRLRIPLLNITKMTDLQKMLLCNPQFMERPSMQEYELHSKHFHAPFKTSFPS